MNDKVRKPTAYEKQMQRVWVIQVRWLKRGSSVRWDKWYAWKDRCFCTREQAQRWINDGAPLANRRQERIVSYMPEVRDDR